MVATQDQHVQQALPMIKRGPLHSLDRFLKRLMDLLGAGLGLLLSLPLFVIIALWIKLNSPGPVLYRGVRVAKGGGDFTMLKFRSMVVDADKTGPSSTGNSDARITGPGRFLRATKLDELPELINVIKGEMSLVGPRPQVRWAVEIYDPEARVLLMVRPGITDPASIRFHNEGEILKDSKDPDGDYLKLIWPEKRRLSIAYVHTRNVAVDAGIIFATVWLTIKKVFRNG